MATVVEQLISRLQSGETIESLLQSFVPPAEQELLKYCAVVRHFDKHLVNKILLPQLSDTSRSAVKFETLKELSDVEAVPGVQGFYQLREDARREYLKLWQEPDTLISSDLKAFSQKLVDYYKKLGPQFDLEVLYHQIAASPSNAEQKFIDLYDAADGGFDLGRCQDVLKIAESRYTILSSTMLELLKDRQYQLRARGLWSREYYQTARYYEIESLKSKFITLWEDRSKWILQLHARGGLGKTMFLRWLIARHCVPSRIPCARIDFDFFDAKEVTQNPSLLLLEIGQQLNEQIPGNFFGEALGDIKEFRPILLKSDRPSSEREQLKTDAIRKGALENISERFIDALKAASKSKRIVIIFDTLEEVILYEGTDLMQLLSELKKLAEGSDSNFCLVLSGRYNLEKKLGGFDKEFGSQSESLELEPWKDADARRYLTEKRGVTRLVNLIIQRADGNPFQLSLYADILRFNPKITAKTIETLPPGLLYLIKRVLSRIEDKRVRWLLRYGVVPRKLRLSFVKEVMAPYLPKAMAGKSKFDDPTKDAHQEKNPFQKVTTSKNEIDFGELWQKLTQYASVNSWVSPDDEENTLSFHVEVLHPMRRLLSRHQIYARLHRAAIRYYERKAKEQPANAGPWIQEAVYHQFQLDPVKGAEYWRQKVNDPLITANPKWVQSLGRDIIDLAVPRDGQKPSETMVNASLLCQAYFEVAQANVKLAQTNQVDPHDLLWREAAKDYRQALRRQEELKRSVIRPARVALVQAAILLNRKKFEEAHSVLEEALRRRPRTHERVELEIEVAESFSRQGDRRQAVRHFRAALNLAARAKLNSVEIIDIRKRLAVHYDALGEYPSAIREYKSALTVAKRVKNSLISFELSRRIAECYLAIGQTEKAYIHLPKAVTGSTLPQFETQVEELRVSLLLGKVDREFLAPLAALSSFDSVLKGIERLRESQTTEPDLNSIHAATREQIGLVHAELMDTSKALDELEEARMLFKDAGDNSSANRCMMHKVEVQLHYARNIKAARELLDQVELLTSEANSPASLAQELLRIKVLDYSGRQFSSERRLRRLASLSKLEKWPIYDRAAIALAGVMHQARSGATISLRDLTSTLRRITPGSQRLVLLKDWRWAPTTPNHIAIRQASSFRSVLPGIDCKKPGGAINALTVTDALRVARKNSTAGNYLRLAYQTFRKTGHTYGLISVRRAADKLRIRNFETATLANDVERFLREYANYPPACAVVQLEQAQRLFSLRRTDEAQQALERAEVTLKNVAISPYYTGWFDELRGRLAIERTWSARRKKPNLEESDINAIKEALLILAAAKNAYKQLDNKRAARRIDQQIAYEEKRIAKLSSDGQGSQRPNTKPGGSSIVDAPADAPTKPAEALAQLALAASGHKLRITRLGATSIAVSSALPDSKSQARRVPQKEMKGLSSILLGSGTAGLNNQFTKLITEQWLTATHEMIAVLATDEALRQRVMPSQNQPSFNLGLEIPDTKLSGAPWEFMLLGDFHYTGLPKLSINCLYRTITDNSLPQRTIRSIQLALEKLYPNQSIVDGVYGPKTMNNVRRFQKENDLEPTGIADYQTIKHLRSVVARKFPTPALIIQPSSEKQLRSDRGHGSGGVDLQAEYYNLGLTAEVLEQPKLGTLTRLLSEIKPKVIHLCPSIKMSSNGINLDFESENQLSLSAVAKVLEQFGYEHKIRPFVILDIPRPSVLPEVVTQLILRNSFAASLMRMINPAAILATGLGERFTSQRLITKSLLTSIAAGVSFAEIVANIRNTTREGPGPTVAEKFDTQQALSELIGPYGTALFTQDPSGLIL